MGPPYTASLGRLEKARREGASTSAPGGRRPSARQDERPEGSRETRHSARAEAALVAESDARADVLAHMRARLRAARRVDIVPVAVESRAIQ